MPATLTAKRPTAARTGIAVPRRMPPVVMDTLRAVTGNGPSYALDEVRRHVKARIAADPGPARGITPATQLHVVWRLAFRDVITEQTGRDPERVTVAGTAITYELAYVAVDAHTGETTPRGLQAQRALNGFLARAHAAQQ